MCLTEIDSISPNSCTFLWMSSFLVILARFPKQIVRLYTTNITNIENMKMAIPCLMHLITKFVRKGAGDEANKLTNIGK